MPAKRQLMALVALVGFFVALYLTLYKVGALGEIVCSVGSCETVQLSRWATFLGLPVAAWGVGFYVAVFALVVAALQPRWEASRALSLALLGLTAWGLVFSLWLTWLELFVIDAICQWCVVSAALVVVLFVLALLDWRERRGGLAAGDTPGADPRRALVE
ncbi:MAG TPA: vitamin K epoxide reductase family protein [Gemmatimonadaceae bacterium]|nr:vitamin K epoxide reductase family protein [Gemmatimonadaceae bacterium]